MSVSKKKVFKINVTTALFRSLLVNRLFKIPQHIYTQRMLRSSLLKDTVNRYTIGNVLSKNTLHMKIIPLKRMPYNNVRTTKKLSQKPQWKPVSWMNLNHVRSLLYLSGKELQWEKSAIKWAASDKELDSSKTVIVMGAQDSFCRDLKPCSITTSEHSTAAASPNWECLHCMDVHGTATKFLFFFQQGENLENWLLLDLGHKQMRPSTAFLPWPFKSVLIL